MAARLALHRGPIHRRTCKISRTAPTMNLPFCFNSYNAVEAFSAEQNLEVMAVMVGERGFMKPLLAANSLRSEPSPWPLILNRGPNQIGKKKKEVIVEPDLKPDAMVDGLGRDI
ncbi:hypothetical protein L1049_003798 [Liquidambar formosana]|uniref:Uncharacterized protein n=1 Tax=Liquidambar formosana TaxID=63359 RepID=A0AAP0RQU5_LIQFO